HIRLRPGLNLVTDKPSLVPLPHRAAVALPGWCYRETCSSETGGRCRGDDAEFSGERNALTCLLNLRDAIIPQPQHGCFTVSLSASAAPEAGPWLRLSAGTRLQPPPVTSQIISSAFRRTERELGAELGAELERRLA
ncbi:hypothetical protein KUCAC02_033204, partial [Chaenocephalus aceratus]